MKLVPASSYDLGVIGSIMQMSRIESLSHSMVLGSGFNSDVNNMQQAPDLVLMNEAFDEPWMIAMLATPHSSYEISGYSLICYLLAMTHFAVQESEETSVLLEPEFLVKSELELQNTQLMLQILLAQAYPYCLRRALSSSFEPDHGFHVVTKPQCSLVHSACIKNMEIICASWRRSRIKFGDGVK